MAAQFEKECLKQIAPQVLAYDWKEESKDIDPSVGRTPTTVAKIMHMDALRKEHGKSWDKVHKGKTCPSVKDIFQNEIWYANAKNLAALPTAARHPCLHNTHEDTLERNRLAVRQKRDKVQIAQIATETKWK